MSLTVLFIGGTGNISLPCVAEAVKAGHAVTVFNRGERGGPLPKGVSAIKGDMKGAAYRNLAAQKFDVVCQFIAFKPDEVIQDIAAFAGHTGQYIFISSASVYQKPPRHYVITEATPAINPYWPYSQDKIACENLLKSARGLNWTIVRPSHTVRTMLPTTFNEGDSVARRMLAKKPVIVVGDGTTPWTLTRCVDFAVPFVRLFGKKEALSDTFHITADHAYTWNEIYRGIAAGLGVEADLVHVPTDTLIRYRPEWEGPLLGDKSWTALFDNSKVKRVAGDFACEKDLAKVLAEPIASVKERIAAEESKADPLEPLLDRIVKEQRGLGG